MTMRERADLAPEWQRKGATLSDKTARKEFGLTQDEIVQAIRAGTLHCRVASMHGNPLLRLLRREVKTLVKEKRGDDYLKDKQVKTEVRHQPRAEAAEGAGRRLGRAEGQADRDLRK